MTTASKKFRFHGIAIFIVVAGLIGVFFVLFLDGIIKDTIEDQGSRIMESQIDVGALSTSILSQSMDIRNLQVANADNLDENLVQIGRMKFDFDGGKALSKKVIIDDMRLEALLLNQKRTVPAKAYKHAHEDPEPKKESEDEFPSMFGIPLELDFKNPKDILKNETLETLEVVKKTKSDLKELKIKWKTQFDQNLSKKSLIQIKQHMKNVKTKSKKLKNFDDIQAFAEELEALQKEIEARVLAIQKMQIDLETDIKQAEKTIDYIASLPQKDFERLRKKYSLDLTGRTGLISEMVSGPLKTRIDKAWGYYKQVSPYLKSSPDSKPETKPMERGKGQNIKFPNSDPFPGFLIRNATLTMNVWEQDVAGNFQGLTSDPKKYGKPFVLKLTGDQNDAFKQFKMKLLLDRTRREAADSLETRVDSLKIKPIPLGKLATLSQGLADISGKIDIQNEQNLNGDFTVKVHGATFAQIKESSNEISRILGNVLKSINQFYIKVIVKGTPDKYTLDIKTDLDEILSKSISNIFDQKIKKFEADLQKLIASKTSAPLSEANGSMNELLDLKKNLNAQESSSKDLLGQASDQPSQGEDPIESVIKKLLPF